MKKDFGSYIQEARKEKGLSVRELAILAKINHTDVSKLENNRIKKPSINMLVALSEVLQTNLLAIYLEDAESYLNYKPLIESCSGLSNDQIQEVIEFINKIKG